jgi:hypothetical protein
MAASEVAMTANIRTLDVDQGIGRPNGTLTFRS